MTLADLTVDIVPIIGAIAGKRRNGARNLLQRTQNIVEGTAQDQCAMFAQ